jgi:hypothetical protein
MEIFIIKKSPLTPLCQRGEIKKGSINDMRDFIFIPPLEKGGRGDLNIDA